MTTTFASPRIDISLDNLIHNVNAIRSQAGIGKGIMAVVKDLAYGCGSVPVSKTLEECGAEWLAVATPAEAHTLRNACIKTPVLVLGEFTKDDLIWGANNAISFSLNKIEDMLAFRECGNTVRFHIHIDTGMTRLGILPDAFQNLLPDLCTNNNIVCEGLYTHLASADIPDTTTVKKQCALFTNVLYAMRSAGISPTHIHYANSAGIMRFPLLPECTLVRPGITLYGCKPDPSQHFSLDVKPLVSLIGNIVRIEKVPANTPVSYCGRYVTQCETNIATVNIGYGIGLPRALTNKGSVLVNEKRYGIAGTVTMDYIMVDAGANCAMKVGDEAVVIGSQGNETITPDDIALCAQTIGYEILCGLSTKIDRYYYKNGAPVHHVPGHYY